MIIDVYGFWYALAIMIFIILAILAVCFIGELFIKFVYYKWDKEERQKNNIIEELSKMQDSGGDF